MLQQQRLEYHPTLPALLRNPDAVLFQPQEKQPVDPSLRTLFPKTVDQTPFLLAPGNLKPHTQPLKVGVVFSGGPAAGGHNILAGLFDALKAPLIGFLDGPSGIVDGKSRTLQAGEIDAYRNQGGFDLLGSGRTKIETPEQLEASAKHCKDLDGLVVVGGDDSNTNAAVLAEYFLSQGIATRVIGVPKTIDGDLQSPDIPISFGFDSACKTYAELIGNIARDCCSARKYYHFVKLMGRSASHIALECAFAVQPNLTLIGEEGKSLSHIVREIATLIEKRRQQGKHHGIILIPEGLVEFIPEIKALIADPEAPSSKETLAKLPEKLQAQLRLERDPHGNIPVSQIDTQQLLMELVRPQVSGKFASQDHFFGYEGRCCYPSNFDATYCYALGYLAALAIRDGLTGVIGAIQNLHLPSAQWQLKAVPLVQLMHLELRKGKQKPVIRKTLVDVKGKVYNHYSRLKTKWELDDLYHYPGPMQFFGPASLTDSIPALVRLRYDQ